MTRLAERLVAHVAELAREYDVTIEHRGRGIAYRRQRRITIPEIRGRSTYFTALHELGHVVGPQPLRRLDQEVAAWRWALDHAIVDLTPGVTRSIIRSLHSYRRRAERGFRGTVLPDGFDDFLVELELTLTPA